jgi:hypothetical protein
MGVDVSLRRRAVPERKQEISIAVVVACVATVLLFLPFGAIALSRAISWANYREDALGYALVLVPYAVTIVACIVAPGAFAMGMAVGLGVVAALGLLIVVPAWGILLSLGGANHPDPVGFVLLGVILLGIQIALVIIARNDLRDARAAGLTGGLPGAAIVPIYVSILFLIALPISERNAAAKMDAKRTAETRAQLLRTRDAYGASDSATITHDQANQRALFIVECLSLHLMSTQKYPSNLQVLGPAGDQCLDSVTASGKFGRWRVVYRPTPPEPRWPIGNYELSATDTADVEVPIYFGRT